MELICCPGCSREFKKRGLKRHIASYHDGRLFGVAPELKLPRFLEKVAEARKVVSCKECRYYDEEKDALHISTRWPERWAFCRHPKRREWLDIAERACFQEHVSVPSWRVLPAIGAGLATGVVAGIGVGFIASAILAPIVSALTGGTSSPGGGLGGSEYFMSQRSAETLDTIAGIIGFVAAVSAGIFGAVYYYNQGKKAFKD